MFTSRNVSKPRAVFLDVKPIMETVKIRKYSDAYDTGVTTRRDSVILYGTESRPSLTSAKSIEIFHKDVFYVNIFPITLYLRLIGVLPITRPGPCKAGFSLLSPIFLYSVVFFFLILAYVGYVSVNRLGIISNLTGPFEEAVIAYLFLVNILPILLVPILWLEAPKIAKVWNDWNDFEVLYFQISGSSVPLNLRKKALIISIVLPIVSIISVVVTHLTMSDFSFIQVVPYCLLDNLTVMLGAYWFISCECLSETAHILAERFQQALRHIGPAGMVADYRAMWLRLSKLCRDTGTATCYTLTYMSLYLFFIITLSIYGLMSQMSEGFGLKDIGLAVTAISNVCLLFFICDEAHYASQNVRTNFQKKLLMVELNWMNSDAQTEINMFLRATEMNPSNINCGGFFDVNRNLFKGLLTTMVTYLVVLLQFQISIPDGGKAKVENSTMSMSDMTTLKPPSG